MIRWRLRKLIKLLNYLVGELYCGRFHRPTFSSVGGWGGRDAWGRRRKAYYGRWCVVCGRHWEKNGKPRPLTPEQNRACAKLLGSMWVGPKD